MKKITLILSLIITISAFATDPQDATQNKWQSYLYIDGFAGFFSSTISEDLPIRQDVSSYSYFDRSTWHIYPSLNGLYAGIKYEIFNPDYKTGISVGLRYVCFNASIAESNTKWNDYFYFKYYESENEMKFARILSLNESMRFLTFPVEVKLHPLQFRKFGLFITAGTELLKLEIDHRFDVEFVQDLMNENKGEVIAALDKNLNGFYSTLYATLGIKIGDINKPNLMFEFILPGLILTEENFALVDSYADFFGGFRMSLQIPINF